jgi:hypothetical protein
MGEITEVSHDLDDSRSFERMVSDTYDEFDLPPESQGRLADNPELFYRRELLTRRYWPFLLLCEDESQGLTWHLLCSDYELENFTDRSQRPIYERMISSIRSQELKIVELIYKHPFKNEQTHYQFDS